MSVKEAQPSPVGILYCAGRRGSLDQAFYTWVLHGTGVKVLPLGGHREVVRQVGKEQGRVAVPVTGVVDRDALPEEILLRQSETVEVLPYFEVESYLVHPELLGPALRSRGREVPESELVGLLLEAARATYMPAINAHLGHAPKARGKGRLEQMAAQYADQLRTADAIIEGEDAEGLLQYFPGRRLSQRVARKLDFLNAQHLLDTILRVPALQDASRPVHRLRAALMHRLGR